MLPHQTIFNINGDNNIVINDVKNSVICIEQNTYNYAEDTSKYGLLEYKLLMGKNIKDFLGNLAYSHRRQTRLLKQPEKLKYLIDYFIKLQKLDVDFTNKEKFLEIINLKLTNDFDNSLISDTQRGIKKILKDGIPIFGREVRNKLQVLSKEYILEKAFLGQADEELIKFILDKNITLNVSCACNSIAAFATIENISRVIPINCSFKDPYGKEQFKKSSLINPYDFIIVGNPAFFFSSHQIRDQYNLVLPLHLEKCSLLSSTQTIKRKYFAGNSATHSSHLLSNSKIESVEIEPMSLLAEDSMLFEANAGFYVWEPLSFYYNNFSKKSPYKHAECEHVISLFVNKELYKKEPKFINSFINVFIGNWTMMGYSRELAENLILERNDYLEAFYISSGFSNL